MAREIYLLVYPSRMFAAHWALWIPGVADPKVGKVIQVNGNPSTGFELEIKRQHNLESTTRPKEATLIAQVKDEYVVDVPKNTPDDQGPIDAIEHHAFSVPAPGPSLNSTSAAVGPPSP